MSGIEWVDLRKMFERIRPPHVEAMSMTCRLIVAERLAVRRGRVEAPEALQMQELRVSVTIAGARGSVFTSHVSEDGLYHAFLEALRLAEGAAARGGARPKPAPRTKKPSKNGAGVGPIKWTVLDFDTKFSLLVDIERRLRSDRGAGVSDSIAAITGAIVSGLSFDDRGHYEVRTEERMVPELAVALAGRHGVCRRSIAGHGLAFRGGFEVLERLRFASAAELLREEADALRGARLAPSGVMNVVAAAIPIRFLVAATAGARAECAIAPPFALDLAGLHAALSGPCAPPICARPRDAAAAERLAGGVERGVLLKGIRYARSSGAAGDARIGCEWGRIIADGRLERVVRVPAMRVERAAAVGARATALLRGVAVIADGT